MEVHLGDVLRRLQNKRSYYGLEMLYLECNRNFEAVNEAVSNIRRGKKIDSSWKNGIEQDYNQRSRK